jgi:hypothetical protein
MVAAATQFPKAAAGIRSGELFRSGRLEEQIKRKEEGLGKWIEEHRRQDHERDPAVLQQLPRRGRPGQKKECEKS